MRDFSEDLVVAVKERVAIRSAKRKHEEHQQFPGLYFLTLLKKVSFWS